MSTKYRIVSSIIFLLLLLSIGLSVLNYYIILQSTKKQLEYSDIPLSTTNIYNEIQKNLIEPNLVSSVMAQDTFLKEWLIHEEHDVESITEYLKSIRKKYGLLTVFLASDKTNKYYTSKGLVEEMSRKRERNLWYYKFKDNNLENEINIDYNKYADNNLIMFINHKIFNANQKMIGAVGVGIKVFYINEMLKQARKTYKLNVYFINEKGRVVLKEEAFNSFHSTRHNSELNDALINPTGGTLKHKYNSQEYITHSKYIPELDLYLIVEAKVSDFTSDVISTFYINLIISLLITTLILLVVLRMVSRNNEKLEHLAQHDTLTSLMNRRSFNDALEQLILRNQRKEQKNSIIFLDIDDFKRVNDTKGHQIGDKVLVRVSKILKETLRQTDLVARWGGEEFIVLCIDSEISDAELIAENIRVKIQNDKELQELLTHELTASFGVTKIAKGESSLELIKRVDKALYKAKEEGKNRIVLSV
ncbi:diguanylate cyclase [Sulfurimonas aquatica]|uniref:diguanylate cyclase n=1 Tax=Sulfurimonas aquatica TaxID=2672570 RepID=A0A975AY05_9BACT|nr:sensor domain-containing diguanylate cyclase [Sulfurimonas aquatica]QSZ40682.1 diguanylate cyclase [Sulfurimonas aquatica]